MVRNNKISAKDAMTVRILELTKIPLFNDSINVCHCRLVGVVHVCWGCEEWWW